MSHHDEACECADHACPHHPGRDCSNVGVCSTLYRRDMADDTGTVFCASCSEDAWDSGLYTDHSGLGDQDEDDERSYGPKR